MNSNLQDYRQKFYNNFLFYPFQPEKIITYQSKKCLSIGIQKGEDNIGSILSSEKAAENVGLFATGSGDYENKDLD